MKVSIVIPTYNALSLLQKNIPTVIKACPNCQLIVVDDAGSDDSSQWLKKNYPKVKVVKNKKNLRFAKSVNKGVSAASGEIVVLLNNDVSPKKNFLAPLLKHFKDSQVFAVGCQEINNESGKEVLSGRGQGKFARGFFIHWRAKNQNAKDTLWVTGGSGAFSKKIWDQLGGLDPLFRPAYEEDRDICYNALKSGYRLVFEPKSQVHHIHETSNIKAFGTRKIQTMSYKNQLLFVWKNISSSKYLLQHLFWLPYHLLFTSIRSKGLFLIAFIKATFQLPEALISRKLVKKHWLIRDEEVFSKQK